MVLASHRPVFALVCFLLVASPVAAAPIVGGLVPDPATISVNTSTPVKITVEIPDPSVIPTGLFLQRVHPNGSVTNLGVMRDDGTNGDAVKGDRIFTLIPTFNEPQTGTIKLRASAAFRGVVKRVFSEPLTIAIGVLVPPTFGATIQGGGNTKLVVPPQSIDVEIVAGIAAVPPTTIVAPVGNLPLAAAVEISVESTELNGSLLPPAEPLQITVPAPAGTAPGQVFIVAQQALVDSPNGTGLRKGLIATAAAVAVGTTIQTQASALPGILQGGTYAVVRAVGSGFVTGQVTLSGVIQPGVVVGSNTNELVALTDENGEFSLFVSGGPFTLTAFHPLRGARGTAAGNIVVHGSTVDVDIALTPLAIPVVTRDGIRNGGFERCVDTDSDGKGNVTGSWAFTGNVRAVSQFQALSGTTTLPTEGKCLAVLSTGNGNSSGATLRQRFTVPAGVTTLRFDYQFLSEELDEWVGSVFNDIFEARVTTPEADTLITRIQVNDFFDPATFGVKTAEFALIGDCVAGGDDTCGRTSWRTAEIDLSRFATVEKPVIVDLVLSVSDRGDNLLDSIVLVDNIRFGTVFIDAKIIAGANANTQRVENEVRQSTEVLSQAGLNVQLRRVLPLPGPANLADVDTTWAPGNAPCPNDLQIDGRLTAEEAQLMLLSRSTVGTDMNVYYVRSSTRVFDGVVKTVNLAGYAVGPDEFCNQVTLLGNGGVMQTNLAFGRLGVLPHEIGHLIIGEDPFSSSLEHNALLNDPSNLMISSGVPANAVVNRNQSANIHRLGNPLILP